MDDTELFWKVAVYFKVFLVKVIKMCSENINGAAASGVSNLWMDSSSQYSLTDDHRGREG